MRRWGIFGAVFAMVAIWAPSASATVYNLTPANANENAMGNGCTFREAAIAAGTDGTNFDCAAGTGDDVLKLAAGNYDLTVVVQLIGGAGEELLIEADGTGPVTLRHVGITPDRIFQIGPTSGDVVFNRVTVSGGDFPFTDNGAAFKVLNDSNLALYNTTVTGNVVGSPANNGSGGAIGMVTGANVLLANTTVSGNSATTEGGGIAQYGGSLSITGSTITDNHSDSDNGGSTGTGGGIYHQGGTLTIGNSIVAGNSDGGTVEGIDCHGFGTGVTSTGGNVIGTNPAQCSFPLSGNDTVAPALLGPLEDNTGPTLTHALLDNSPALDHGVLANCLVDDQRGILRPQGPTCDSGAFERVVPAVPPPGGGGTPPIATPPAKKCKKPKKKSKKALKKFKKCKKKAKRG